MAFHIFDLGPLSGQVQKYADLDGLIPEVGSDWREFHWSHNEIQLLTDKEQGAEVWKTFIREASIATGAALEALEALHDSN
jgi:hypothetical protein